MAMTNRTSGNENQNFKQIERDGWSGIYLPAICAAVVMTIVLLMAVSCSKKSENAAKISAPAAPPVETPAPSTSTAAAIPQTPKKAVRKHRPVNATYVNSTYGVSFSYPRKYSLQSGDQQKDAPVESGFTKPGAVEIASVDLPDDGYPETDFSSALLNVSLNTGMSAEECGQFAAGKDGGSTQTSSDAKVDATTQPKPADSEGKPEAVKLGANQFSEVERMQGAGEKQSDVKYFHLFKNGGCYEFALDVETSRKADEELAQVDRGQVFKKLEKILSTARIKEVDLPGMGNAEKSQPVESTPAATTQMEKAQVVNPPSPEQK
jgi:hypothetical protein